MEADAPRPAPTRPLARRVARVALPTLGLALLGYAAVSLVAADLLTRPSNRKATLDPRAIGRDVRPWSTTTDDGLTLRGWYCPGPAHRRLIVLVHGMGGAWGEMAEIGRGLHRRGYDILLFDLRGHGESDPARLSMGRHERGDLRAVLAWALAEGYAPERVGWLGHSLGASTLLMEAATNPAIQVAVVDSPFADLPDLLAGQLPAHSHLPSWFNPGILFAARRAFGVRTDDLRPIADAPGWGLRPILLFHGTADTVVPVRQAYALIDALGSACEAVVLPGVRHVGAFGSNPGGYLRRVDGFFDRHLAR